MRQIRNFIHLPCQPHNAVLLMLSCSYETKEEESGYTGEKSSSTLSSHVASSTSSRTPSLDVRRELARNSDTILAG